MNDKLPTPDPDFPESGRFENEHQLRDPGRAEDEHLQGKPRRWPWIVAVVAALFVGVGIGAASAETTPAAVETPEPETIVETVVETETVTEIVEATPGVCLIAMESADEILEVSGEVFGIVSDVAHDVGDILNADGYLVTAEWNAIDDAAYVRMEPLQDRLSSAVDEYLFASLACEALAEGN